MLCARNISFSVSSRALLDDVSVSLRPGRLLAVVGPNGAGKSTLVSLLSGERRPSRGTIELDGRALSSYSARELAHRRAVVPQANHLDFPLTVAEVVLLGRSVPGLLEPTAADQQQCQDILARVGLAGFASRHCTTLSGGERQRMHLARAFLQLAKAANSGTDRLLLLDEPTASLDLAHQLQVLQEVRKEAGDGCAVLVVLHDLNLAARYADEIMVMGNGRVAGHGTPREIFDDGLLSGVFGCVIEANRSPGGGEPFVLPQMCRSRE